MVSCGVSSGNTGNVTAQDVTVSLSAVDMLSVVPANDTASSPLEDVCSVIQDHSYLPTNLGRLTENALVYIGRFADR